MKWDYDAVSEWIKKIEAKQQINWQEANLLVAYRSAERIYKLMCEIDSLKSNIYTLRDWLLPMLDKFTKDRLIDLLKQEKQPRTLQWFSNRLGGRYPYELLEELVKTGQVIQTKTSRNRNLYRWNGE